MAGIPDCTLVTASYLFTRYHANSRNKEDTLKAMDTLLSIPCYLVIYCDADLVESICERRKDFSYMTHVIVKPFEELWCYGLLEKVKKNRELFWPTRDVRTCAETHLITCNKADFVLQTMDLNPFSTSKFGWIDANIGENGSKISQQYSNHLLLSILNRVDDRFHLQLLNVTDKKYKQPEWKRECYMQYRWLACGCLFTTSVGIGRRILTRIKELIVQTTDMGYGHGEEMFYLEILDEFYDDIHRAYGDYRDLLHNFIEPTTSFVYIYWNLVMRYDQMGYHKECMDACMTLIKQFDQYAVEINYDLYVRLYFAYYLAAQKSQQTDRMEWAAKQIRSYYRSNPYFANQYRNLQHLCGMSAFSV
jgi:hypothetical protein